MPDLDLEQVAFQPQAVDADGEPISGAWDAAAGFNRMVKVVFLRGGEGVREARMQGLQPAVMTVSDDDETRAVDNTWRVVGQTPRIAGMIFDIKATAPARERFKRDFTVEQNGTLGGP